MIDILLKLIELCTLIIVIFISFNGFFIGLAWLSTYPLCTRRWFSLQFYYGWWRLISCNAKNKIFIINALLFAESQYYLESIKNFSRRLFVQFSILLVYLRYLFSRISEFNWFRLTFFHCVTDFSFVKSSRRSYRIFQSLFPLIYFSSFFMIFSIFLFFAPERLFFLLLKSSLDLDFAVCINLSEFALTEMFTDLFFRVTPTSLEKVVCAAQNWQTVSEQIIQQRLAETAQVWETAWRKNIEVTNICNNLPAYREYCTILDILNSSKTADLKILKLTALTIFFGLTGIGASHSYLSYYLFISTAAYVSELWGEM